ncbi:MAG: type I-MYXAN CRISPR-associated protein Cas6/Cmx6 [Gammaproteobacteria bacterium]|nr:type I-MYXAN CRISPR-associated protein Cas6/Cmx6 [Gammaproteobacteria bacterium]
MLWKDSDKNTTNATDSVLDLVFSIRCKSLPSDHAFPLSQALQQLLPWFVEEKHAGMHIVHIMTSGHGWTRPTGDGALLLPSRRTKFILRLPKHRVDDARTTLTGKTLDVDGHALTIDSALTRPLSDITTVIARYIVTDGNQEDVFTQDVINQMHSMGVKPNKLLCGVEKTIMIDKQLIATRSVMVADMSEEESLLLQQNGLGPYREYGCGLFIPQKDINEI